MAMARFNYRRRRLQTTSSTVFTYRARIEKRDEAKVARLRLRITNLMMLQWAVTTLHYGRYRCSPSAAPGVLRMTPMWDGDA